MRVALGSTRQIACPVAFPTIHVAQGLRFHGVWMANAVLCHHPRGSAINRPFVVVSGHGMCNSTRLRAGIPHMFALPTSMAHKMQRQCVYVRVCVCEGTDSCKMASQTLMGRQNPDIQARTPLQRGHGRTRGTSVCL